ncbi:hypothetical protein [Janthinobacterium sp. B9-8]|uniref:hypothetical protein n=1 Tax=Janthinobacterium sp. B9-8 TaxID=1236179 RepID=UPI00061CE8D5|nr:hypothetical protein [Janthinobacterium sp. B9-8]AMC34740.1 hypothetical protein VN23_09025 [Janthinobacterium sp. B9-8]
MTEPKKVTDWERIERLYRAGKLSNHALAAQCDVTEGAIRKRAKRDGWEKDLSARVDVAVKAKLARAPMLTKSHATEREIVEEAASTAVALVLGHRTEIARLQLLAKTMANQLTDATENEQMMIDEIVIVTAEDEGDRRRLRMEAAVALPARVDTLKKLTDSWKTIVSLGREAFSLDKPEAPKDPLEDLTEDELDAKLAQYLPKN